MPPIVITIINFLLSLSFLIVLHELGHFIPARLFNTRVEKFFLFFDIKFSLFKKKIGDTVYGIGWLPLGGYVKISGMIDESMDKEQMEQPPQPWEFRSKPAWQRLIIMLGGVIVNVLVGFAIYILLIFNNGEQRALGTDYKYGFGFPETLEKVGFKQGDQVLLVNNDTLQQARLLNQRLIFRDVKTVTVIRDNKPVTLSIPQDIGTRLFNDGVPAVLEYRFPFAVDSVATGSPAEKIGLVKGAKIVSVANHPVTYYTDFVYAMNHKVTLEKPFEVVYEIDGQQVVKEASLKGQKKKLLGVYAKPVEEDIVKVTDVRYGFGESIAKGISSGYWAMSDYITQFKYVFTSKGASQLGGFGTIAKLYPDTFNWTQFWQTTAWISFVLAIMNILPIPALDGGHVMFLLYEMITGRKPGDKFLERAQIAGILILLTLMVYANGNDIYKWVMERFF